MTNNMQQLKNKHTLPTQTERASASSLSSTDDVPAKHHQVTSNLRNSQMQVLFHVATLSSSKSISPCNLNKSLPYDTYVHHKQLQKLKT